ncbi:hypothetical protein Dda_8264 [Drechslerella dactyloides]|uniref:Uncharacterized protein n=1 Tax=Drechslerella dactyloides TaxID=74499 RepID=A0AAD6IRQ4_DREDA|nr:hypothetical protein Dda_8264 [Drechslerella dactyloides]
MSSSTDLRYLLGMWPILKIIEFQPKDGSAGAVILSQKLELLKKFLSPDLKDNMGRLCDEIQEYALGDDGTLDYTDPDQVSNQLHRLESAIERIQYEMHLSLWIEEFTPRMLEEVDRFFIAWKAKEQSCIIISPVGEWATYSDTDGSYKHIHDADILRLLECKNVLGKLTAVSHEEIRQALWLAEEKLKSEHFIKRLDLMEAGGNPALFVEYDGDNYVEDIPSDDAISNGDITESAAPHDNEDSQGQGESDSLGLFPIFQAR